LRTCGKLHGMVGLVQELETLVLGRSSRDIITRETADAGDHMAELQDVLSSNLVFCF
jgi:hypothetical protein